MRGHSEHDHELEAAYAELRRRDSARAPSFRTVRDAALAGASRQARRTRAAWSVAAAALLGAIALTATFLGGSGRGAADLTAEIAMAAELSSWSAPTDALYDLASLDIPDSVPGLELGSGYVPDALGSGASQTAAAASPARTESEVER